MIISEVTARPFHLSYQIDGLQSVDSKTRVGNTSLSSYKKTANRSTLLPAFGSEQKLRTRQIKLLSPQSQKLSPVPGSDNEDNGIESAFNYLMLRDLGCSRAEAIRYASPKFANRRSFITNLPPKLRGEYKQSLLKCKYRPGTNFMSKDEFEHISQAVRSYVDRHSENYFASPEEQNKFYELARHKNKVKFEIKVKDYEPEKVCSVFASPKRKNKKRLTLTRRVIVPDVKSMEKAIKENTFGSFLSPTAKSKQPSIDRRSQDAMKSETKPVNLLEVISDKNDNKITNKIKSKIHKSSGYFDRDVHDGTYSSIHENFNNESIEKKREENFNKKNQRCDTFIELPSETPQIKEARVTGMRSEDFNILGDFGDDETENYNFQNIIDEQRKYLDIFRMQKYQLAQKKGELLQSSLQKNQERKALIEMRERDLKLKNFEIKKEKIKNALIRKNTLTAGKFKQNSKTNR